MPANGLAPREPGPYPHVKAAVGHATRTKSHSAVPNEDRAVWEEVCQGVSLCTVLDGHKGSTCVDFVQNNLHSAIKRQPGMELVADDVRNARQALIDGYLECDVVFLKEMDKMEKQVVLVEGTEIDVSTQVKESGSTGVSALIVGNQMFVANVGDSRCVVCRGGVSLGLTEDQTCSREDERLRVEKSGALIMRGRVYGDLMVTRSFGDRGFKFTKAESNAQGDDGADGSSPQAYIASPKASNTSLTAQPEVEAHTLKPADEFMILATDGLWNAMSNMEAVTFVHDFFASPPSAALRCAPDRTLAAAAATALTDEAISRRHKHDDITVLVVKFTMKDLRNTALSAPISLS